MVRFQADADFNQILVAALVRRVPDVDFRTAEIALLRGLTDAEVLALSAREGPILVTRDSKTMPRHFGEFVGSNQSPGVIVVPQHLPVSVVVDELQLIWMATSPEDWTNRIAYLPL